jgi:hypothetical protein
MPAELDPVPDGTVRRPSRLTDLLDPDGFDDAGLVRELSAVARSEAELAAYEGGAGGDDGRSPAGGERPLPIACIEPTPAQRRFVQASNRTCRHPGCRRPAARTARTRMVSG